MSDSRATYPDGVSPDSEDAEIRRDPDRQLFHLKTLYEASRELAEPATPKDILNRFPLVAMGPLGSSFSFVILKHEDQLLTKSVGLGQTSQEKIAASGHDLISKFFPDDHSARTRPVILAGRHLSNDPNLPAGTCVIVALPVDKGSHAVLGFGPKVNGVDYGDDELELLEGMASILATVLRKVCADTCIRALNGQLCDRNRRMMEALTQAEEARAHLSTRAFELQALFETTTELSALNEPDAILDAFTLSVMGTLGYAGGWIGLYGPGENDVAVAYRGTWPEDRDRLASSQGRNAVLAQFVALKDRMPHAHQCHLLADETVFSQLPVPAETGVLFCLDHGWRGAIGLCDPLSDTPLSDEKKQLLLSLTTAFIATLGNARQLKMVRDLNSDLAARNVDLQTTLNALTSARQEIGLLTEAKESVLRMVRGEVARVERASWFDVGLILLAGIVLGFLFNSSSPSGIPIAPPSLLESPPAMVDVSGAKRLVRDQQAVIIDARPADFYREEHIKGAINLPKNLFNFVYSMKLSALDPTTPLVVYGRTFSRRYDEDVARELTQLGHENVQVIERGLNGWKAAGHEVEP